MTVAGILFMEDVDNAALAGLTPAAGEQTVFVTGDDARVPTDFNQIVAYHLVGSAITRGQITSPSIRAIAPIEVLPIDDAAEPTSNFPPQKQLDNPVQLESGEALNFNTTNSGAAATEQYGFVWLADSPVTPFTGGNIMHVLATGAITATVDTWTDGQLTLADDLPNGRYAVVGFRAEGTSLVAARLIFTGQAMRPMVIGYDDEADIEDEIFRDGKMGILGEFDHDSPPRLEVMCVAADTTQQVILDIVKIS
jgi:hypothetical protein